MKTELTRLEHSIKCTGQKKREKREKKYDSNISTWGVEVNGDGMC